MKEKISKRSESDAAFLPPKFSLTFLKHFWNCDSLFIFGSFFFFKALISDLVLLIQKM